MSQNPIDAFSKELLSELLSPFGKVERSFEAPGESISQVKTMAYPQVYLDWEAATEARGGQKNNNVFYSLTQRRVKSPSAVIVAPGHQILQRKLQC